MSVSTVGCTVAMQPNSKARSLPAGLPFLFLEIQALSLLKDCRGKEPDDVLTASKHLFELCQKDPHRPEIDRWITEQLRQLSANRHAIVARFVRDHRLKEAISPLQKLNDTLDKWVSQGAPEGWSDEWESALERFQSIYWQSLAEDQLRGAYRSQYALAARQVQILDCYLTWEKNLQTRGKELQSARGASIKSRCLTAVKINLLISAKGSWLEQSLQMPPSTRSKSFAMDEKSLQNESARLLRETEACKKRIALSERLFLGNMNWFSRSVSAVASVLLNSRYVRRADFLVTSQERVMQKYVWHDEPLTGFYLGLSKGLTTAGLFGMDLAQWTLAGLSWNIPDAVAHSLTPGTDSVVKVFKTLRVGDDKTAVRCMDIMRNCVQLGVVVGFSGYWESRSVAETSVVYGMVIGVSYCAGKCVDLFYQMKYGTKECPTYPFARGVTQMASFTLAGRYAVPSILEWWHAPSLTPDTVLINPESCRTFPVECKRMACAELGLSSETATKKEISTRYHQLARLLHPDQLSGNRSAFRQLSEVYAQCKKS